MTTELLAVALTKHFSLAKTASLLLEFLKVRLGSLGSASGHL